MRIELILSDDVINPASEDFDLVIRIGELDKKLRLAAKPLPAYRFVHALLLNTWQSTVIQNNLLI